ncbi:MAG: chorismate lyase [Gammaproteobacteria bacterium]|nr:MAG: chorismate lyase [Gammaproteobacteria bacterium]
MSEPPRTPHRWLDPRRSGLQGAPPRLREWLCHSGSLSHRLERCPGPFRVRLLRQGLVRPSREEARFLALRNGQWAWVRESLLEVGGNPWVFARSVIPVRSRQGPLRRLPRLGHQPLGELLFGDGGSRQSLEVCRLRPGDPLLQGMPDPPPQPVWCRRSGFRRHGCRLLVLEAFLPGFGGAVR